MNYELAVSDRDVT